MPVSTTTDFAAAAPAATGPVKPAAVPDTSAPAASPAAAAALPAADSRGPVATVLCKLPVSLWTSHIFTRCFDATDRRDRTSLVAALPTSRAMFAAAAPALYARPPLARLSYQSTKKFFTDALLKSDRPDRASKGRHYGRMVRDLPLAECVVEFAEKKMTDANVHAIVSLCPDLERLSLPFSRTVAEARRASAVKLPSPPSQDSAAAAAAAAAAAFKSPEPVLRTLGSPVTDNTPNPGTPTAPPAPPADAPGLTDRTLHSVARVAGAGTLHTIVIDNVYDYSPAAVAHLVDHAPGLKRLELQARFAPRYGPAAGDKARTGELLAEALVQGGAAGRLAYLALTEIEIPPGAWGNLMLAIGATAELRALHLSGVPLTPAAVGALGAVAPFLEDLSTAMGSVTDPSVVPDDAAVAAVVARMPHLRSISLQQTMVGDGVVAALVKAAPANLAAVTLVEANVSNVVVLGELAAACPKLGWMDLSGCPRVVNNRQWAHVFNLDEAVNDDECDEPWWRSDDKEFTVGPRRIQEMRDCHAKRTGRGG
ncbi:hypothetical protein AMAG_11031 [Allomyces macrogynus ATCC 38327]|uniref:Uncharacterized protein n=1 Tax=Allomyces macrogynus (strain ATCC 38327) TaxID=578462 RepID=A0A0L0SSP3_ALLM3|nr:hypothetical protein AMAG_11031 [Allomyces macrogynus ATCC 38327]|eukprot:KNE65400.1 hypothetical protein AMAG_11031 [Allomyces macrogynus ATCC 38327]